MIRTNQKNRILELLQNIDNVTIVVDSAMPNSFPIIYIKSSNIIMEEVIDNETYNDKYVYTISIILPTNDSQYISRYNENLMDNLEQAVLAILRDRETRNNQEYWQDLRLVEVTSVYNNDFLIVDKANIRKDFIVEVDTIVNY